MCSITYKATFTLGVFYYQHAGCMHDAYAGLSDVDASGQTVGRRPLHVDRKIRPE